MAFFCLLGCGGKEFASGGSGGASARAGSDNSGGDSQGGSTSGGTETGGEPSGGASVTGGSGGRGGSGPSDCSCAAGSYCRDASLDCLPCTSMNRLYFTTPERLASVSSGQGSRYPRVGGTGTDLLYQFDGVGLRYTTDSSTSAGSNVAQTTPDDAAPLLLPANVDTAPGDPFNFVFDRPGANQLRGLYFGKWSNGLEQAGLAPEPYNGGSTNFGMAISQVGRADATPRAFWMSDRVLGKPLVLMTALLEPGATAELVDLQIGQEGCRPEGYQPLDAAAPLPPLSSYGSTPWITASGETLLLSNTRVDATCQPTGRGSDLYTALMLPETGQPLGPAIALADVNSEHDDIDPSFSADYCELYFSSNRDGEFALYRAHRR